jgi:hypothetical protein
VSASNDPSNARPELEFYRMGITPSVLDKVHANIKAAFEYQIRPQQIVFNPTTGLALTNPFRTNSAVAGLEWVY